MTIVSRVRFALLYALAWTPLAALYAIVLSPRPGVERSGAIWGAVAAVGTAALLGLPAWWASMRI